MRHQGLRQTTEEDGREKGQEAGEVTEIVTRNGVEIAPRQRLKRGDRGERRAGRVESEAFNFEW